LLLINEDLIMPRKNSVRVNDISISKYHYLKKLHLRHHALIMVFLTCSIYFVLNPETVYAQTTQGEIEGRAAPVARRKCVGGTNAGTLCNQNGSCPGSTCTDRNVFNISVAVQFNANTSELTTIQNLISAGSATLFDVTDGQAEIGEAFIYNNAFGTGSDADLRIYPSTSPTWWMANTGSWQVGGSIHVSINNVSSAPNMGESLAHEFTHLVFDARDEYESGCTPNYTSEHCPNASAIAAGQASCLMDQGGIAGADHSEYCWGQGNSANLTDMSGGNHDATNVTEQSRCRSNRSCWAQVLWSWPHVFLAPAGAPDPAANGATVNATHFITPNNTTRVVLVLDESGSMGTESPSRLNRLKVAAKDFIALAETGTELGIVSYSDDAESSSGRANVSISTLGSNRAAYNNAIDGLNPTAFTNIGAGLQKAKDMIMAAGGITANTFIVLMTDGLNNRPSPQSNADADLQTKINDLLNSGIPVLVTCTGTDLGLASQCSEIASGTGGFYVDSRDAATLAEAFIDFHERIARRDAIRSYTKWFDPSNMTAGTAVSSEVFYIEEGAESSTFILIWKDALVRGSMTMVDPQGNIYKCADMPQGVFFRIKNPMKGEWKMIPSWPGNIPAHYVARGYSRNYIHSLSGGVRYPSVLPGNSLYIYGYPRSFGGSVTGGTKKMSCKVIRPDGSIDNMELNDMGHLLAGGGDDIENDGIFTGVYSKTDLKGPYQFLISADIDRWHPSEDRGMLDLKTMSPRFVREVRVSAAVGDPKDIEPNPDDVVNTKEPPCHTDWCKWLDYLIILLIILVIYLIFYLRRRQKRG
jgi:hypothetical protein